MSQPDYGLPDSKPLGPPRLIREDRCSPESYIREDLECPRCGGFTCFKLQINVVQKLVRGGKGIGTYIGCAGCGWASPMVVRTSSD